MNWFDDRVCGVQKFVVHQVWIVMAVNTFAFDQQLDALNEKIVEVTVNKEADPNGKSDEVSKLMKWLFFQTLLEHRNFSEFFLKNLFIQYPGMQAQQSF